MNEKHRTIKNFDSAAFALAGGIGPWLAPLAPALVFGSAFSHSMWAQLGWLAVAGGIVAGIGLVVAGAFASHNAIERGGGWWFAAISYVALEIGGLWAMQIDFNMQVVGTVLALITFIVYISRAGAVQITESKALSAEERADSREFTKQLQLEKVKLEHERSMQLDRLQTEATIEAERERTKATTSQAEATAKAEQSRLERERLALQAAQDRAERERLQRLAEIEQARAAQVAEQARLVAEASRIVCDRCEREFKTQGALNAHSRFCSGVEAETSKAQATTNGKH